MKSKSLSGEEIVKIIDACAKRKVVKLKLGDLELDFQPRSTQSPATGPAIPAPSPQVLVEQTQEQEKSILKDETDLKEEQLAELQLTNPAEYERLLLAGKIELDEESDGHSLDQ